jgi:hypothetical protein
MLAAVFLTAPAVAQTPAAPKPVKEGIDTTFDIGLGAVFVDIDGSREKFRTERDLRPGFNVSNVRLELRPVEGATSFFNSAVLTAFGIGDSSPYQRAMFRIQKAKLYDFDASYRKYNMYFGLPDFAFGLHSEDSVGRSMRFALKLLPDRKVSFRTSYRRNQLYGTRFSSQNLILDTYPVYYPRRLASDDFGGGVVLQAKTASLSVDQHWVRFRDDQQLFATGATGVAGNVLESGQRDLPARISNPVSTVVGRFEPNQRYDVVARYMYSGADLDITRYEDLLNLLGSGRVPVRQIISGSGVSTKPAYNASLGQTLDITDRLAFHHRFFYDHYSITGVMDIVGVLDGPTEFPFELSDGTSTNYSWAFNEAELNYDLTRTVSVLGRYSYGDRHMRFGAMDTPERRVVTITHAGGGCVSWIPSAQGRLSAEVEKGVASQVFNRIEPLDFLRWKLRGQFRPTPKLTLTANLFVEDNSTDVPDVNRDLDNRQLGIQAVQLIGRQAVVSGGYNYLRIRSSTDIVFYLLDQLTRGKSDYETDMHLAHFLVQVPVAERLELRLGYNYLKDAGATYPLRMHLPRAGFTVWLARNAGIEADWQHYSYNEQLGSILDYRANALAVGLRFRK